MITVEIESKRTVLENTKKARLDKVNLELVPIKAQIQQLESRANQITLEAVQDLGRIDGQLEMLAEMANELKPVPAAVLADQAA